MSSTAPDINPAKKDNTEQSIAMQCDTVRGVYKEPPNLVRFVLMCASFAVSAGRSVMKWRSENGRLVAFFSGHVIHWAL